MVIEKFQPAIINNEKIQVDLVYLKAHDNKTALYVFTAIRNVFGDAIFYNPQKGYFITKIYYLGRKRIESKFKLGIHHKTLIPNELKVLLKGFWTSKYKKKQ